jgi:hypothetical protein
MLRRPVIYPATARAWQCAKEQFADVVAELDRLTWELTLTKQSLHEVRSALQELLAARREREMAEAELVKLYRERAIQRAQAAERYPALLLQ